MSSRPAKFTAMPEVPHGGLGPMEYELLNSLKQNVELLTGMRGQAGTFNRAITSGQVTVEPAKLQGGQQITATGAGVSIEGAAVPTLEDYAQLMTDVQTVMNDLSALRATLNTLIQQLRS